MTKETALYIASHFGLEAEVANEINNGLAPELALYEWDLLQSYSTPVSKSIVSGL